MISRAACAPRICLACRLSLARRSAARRFPTTAIWNGHGHQRYASGPSSFDKTLIERIISGEISDENAEKIFRKNQALERRRQRKDNDLPDWGLNKSQGQFVLEEIEKPLPKEEHQLESKEETESTIESEERAESSLSSTSAGEAESTSTSDQTQESSLPEGSKPSEHVDDNAVLDPDHNAGPEIEILPRPRRSDSDTSGRRTGRKPGRQNPVDELLQDKALNVSALGSPISAIVIKNPNEMRVSKGPITELDEMPQDSSSALDWNKVLSRGQDAVEGDGEDYLQNLGELRPRDTRVLRMMEYQKLKTELVEGFMTMQLREYFRDNGLEESCDAEDVPDYSWITKQIPWSPTNNLSTESETEKEKLARRIILEKWQLQIQDHVDGSGRAYVWVQPDIFTLITQGPYSVLDSLREEFLVGANNERMTTASSESRINIHSTKATAYAVLSRINEITKRLQSRTVRLPRRVQATQSELQELARITNTTIKYVRRGNEKELEVSWLSEGEEPVPPAKQRNEDPADIVFRLATLRPYQGVKQSAQTILPFESQAEDGGIFVDFHREPKSLSWRDKLRSWARVVQPVSKDQTTEPSTLRLSELAYISDAPFEKSGVKNYTIATFGSILHSNRGSDLSSTIRVLCPVVPHPAAFSALKADDNEPPKQSTSIILNFVPSISTDPDVKSSRATFGPKIRLCLPVDADADLSSFSLPADATFDVVVPWNVNDIMLPANSVDVRIAHHRYLPLDIKQPGLKDFMETAEFNLLAGRLRTPSKATFSLPKKYLDLSYTGSSKHGSPIDVPYQFSGLEIHQTVEMPWRGHTLRYSSIEAGQHGGQRQELSIQAGHPGAQVAFADEHRVSFLDLVDEIASGKCFSWDEGYKDMKETLFEDHSYDLPEEALGDDFIVTESEEMKDEQDITGASEKMVLEEYDPSNTNGKATLSRADPFGRLEDHDYYEEEVGLTPEEKEEMEREIDALLQLDSRPGNFRKGDSTRSDLDEHAPIEENQSSEPSASENLAWLRQHAKDDPPLLPEETSGLNEAPEASSDNEHDLKGETASESTVQDVQSKDPSTTAERSPKTSQDIESASASDAQSTEDSQIADLADAISQENDGPTVLKSENPESEAEMPHDKDGDKARGAEERGKD